jgi:hypothetical protein
MFVGHTQSESEQVAALVHGPLPSSSPSGRWHVHIAGLKVKVGIGVWKVNKGSVSISVPRVLVVCQFGHLE